MSVEERHAAVTAIFLEACRLATEQQRTFLIRRCGSDIELRAEVEAMLRADGTLGGFLEQPISSSGLWLEDKGYSTTQDSNVFSSTTSIGRYKLIRIIGRGGTAVVYLAEQDNPTRSVALKVLRPGFSSNSASRRLEEESRILARLQHPGIAQVFDAGFTEKAEGRSPYFAMEFVDGLSLTEYAAAHTLGTRQKLDILLRISDALEHAHQRGVIHRDLKPANILVSNCGEPKVLDFGIARATDCDVRATTLRTEIGQLIGTVSYMSPEQTMGDANTLDTRTDIYSLAVVAYELLTGRLPHALDHKSIPEAIRMIREENPLPPSRIMAALRGDIETILLKALEKDRNLRFQTVSEFAADVRRYLSDEPIQARPPSLIYQFRKFAKRHRGLVWGSVSAIAALVLGAVGMSVQAVRATNERNRAVAAERHSAAMASVWAQTLEQANLWKLGNAVAVEELLDDVANRIEILKTDPVAEASLRLALGKGYRAFGVSVPVLRQMSKAAWQLQQAYELRHRTLGESAPETVEALIEHATAFSDLVSLELAPLGNGPPFDAEREAQAQALRRKALASATEILGQDNARTLAFQIYVAGKLEYQDKPAMAIALLNTVLVRQSRTQGEDVIESLQTMSKIAGLQVAIGQPAEAEDTLRRAYDLSLHKHGSSAKITNDLRLLLAWRLWDASTEASKNRWEEAVALFEEAVAVCLGATGDEDPQTLMNMNNFAALLMDAGQLDRAEEVIQRVIANRTRVLGPTASHTIRSRIRHASLLVRMKRANEAEPLFRQLMQDMSESLPSGHVDFGSVESLYGECLATLGRDEEAETFLVSGFEKAKTSGGPQDPITVRALQRLMKFLTEQGRPNEAAELEVR